MDCDFSGWATKASVKCSDGRTIAPNAFQHQDKIQVPLVWQHGHTNPENVLGHAVLENRDEGVYAYCFFNDTDRAKHAKEAVKHKDINHMSIWANELLQRSQRVLHGAIREVSLVLSGANPGALIENVQISHSDTGDLETLQEEAIITTGLELEHSDKDIDVNLDDLEELKVDGLTEADVETIVQRQLQLQHADEDKTVQDVYNSMSDEQKQVLHYMVGAALESADAEHSNLNDDGTPTQEGKGEMRHNVFESGEDGVKGAQLVLSHDDMKSIVDDASNGKRNLSDAVKDYALSHGIEDIDVLFPEARNVDNTPELIQRRTEWVNVLMSGIVKSPFGRIKTRSADLTVAEARAKGYITGTLKKEEFFKLSKRITEPTTIYKKQKLDRDDMVDITDFDVVVWLKAEMRLMLDEEIARAVLVGDGRAAGDEDKVNEDKIRPVATDSELYTTTITVNIDDASSNMHEVADAIALQRGALRGSGLPTLFTTETYIARWLTQRDTLGRRIYQSIDQLATELRVKDIVAVEILEEYADIVGILFNPTDYTVGSTAGGEVSMFDDFDIDYNQYKYLIETRLSGALTKMRSAMVVRRSNAADVQITPPAPEFDGTEVTITDTTGVVYRNADTDDVMNAAGSPYAVAEDESINIHAEPAAGYFFPSSMVDDWSFTNEGA